ncbi:MAG TPA: nucleoside triphosphate pyrophosphohydrolase [Gemmatimonadota bacterium]|nr:nucleoside triphosphate pyrophosphohydrolase [Gemmatimonadota bacterium]
MGESEPPGGSAGFEPRFEGVLALLRRLRGPEGCPWDREQTPRSLLPYLIEEAHEVAHAIEAGDDRAATDELGDLLLHVAFQIVIAEEEARFDMQAVAGGLIAKMVRRHPHVFGDAEYQGQGHQAMWERLKREEKASADDSGVIGRLPEHLPTLVRAYRMQEKAASIGFDWPDAAGARRKVDEEIAETDGEAAAGTPESLEEEFGDLLFALVNWGRLLGVHPDTALRRANRKFESRFRGLEALAAERGIDVERSSLDVLDGLWNEVKSAERG